MYKKFADWISKHLAPIGNKLGANKHLSAITNGTTITIPFLLLGAFSNILSSLPSAMDLFKTTEGFFPSIYEAIYEFTVTYHNFFVAPYNLTTGLISVIMVAGIANSLAKSYKMKTLSTTVTAVIMFLMVCTDLQSIAMPDGTFANMFNAEYLGTSGMFISIVIAFLSVEVTRFCLEKHLAFKMPSAIPSMVGESLSQIIPFLFNIIVIYGINILIISLTGRSFPAWFLSIITPALNAINTPLFVILITELGCVAWLFGIHSNAVSGAVLGTLFVQCVMSNAALVASGQPAVFEPVFLMLLASVGGTGGTIGLTILMCRSKSTQLKTVGRVGLIPSLCNINEPIIFGTPILYNPIMAIPFLLTPLVTMSLGWLAYSIGFLKPMYIFMFSIMPMGVAEFLCSMSFTNFLFQYMMIPVSMLIYYPFFKAYEKQLVEKETGEAAIEQ